MCCALFIYQIPRSYNKVKITLLVVCHISCIVHIAGLTICNQGDTYWGYVRFYLYHMIWSDRWC